MKFPKNIRLNLWQTSLVVLLLCALMSWVFYSFYEIDRLSSEKAHEIQNLQKQKAELQKSSEKKLQTWRILYTLNLMTNGKISADQQKKLLGKLLPLSHNYKIDPILILSIVYVESRGQLKLTSSQGAKGMMQIQPRTARVIATRLGYHKNEKIALSEIETNIELGTLYFISLLERYNNTTQALVAYNRGETFVDKAIKNHKKMPRAYSSEVFKMYRYFKNQIEMQ